MIKYNEYVCVCKCTCSEQQCFHKLRVKKYLKSLTLSLLKFSANPLFSSINVLFDSVSSATFSVASKPSAAATPNLDISSLSFFFSAWRASTSYKKVS